MNIISIISLYIFKIIGIIIILYLVFECIRLMYLRNKLSRFRQFADHVNITIDSCNRELSYTENQQVLFNTLSKLNDYQDTLVILSAILDNNNIDRIIKPNRPWKWSISEFTTRRDSKYSTFKKVYKQYKSKRECV